jgi:hypothetical protein
MNNLALDDEAFGSQLHALPTEPTQPVLVRYDVLLTFCTDNGWLTGRDKRD